MKSDEILLSPNHGLNPSISKCPICHKEIGIILFGKLKEDKQAPMEVEIELCEECKKLYSIIHEAIEEFGKAKYTGRILYMKKEALPEHLQSYNDIAMESKVFNHIIENINDN